LVCEDNYKGYADIRGGSLDMGHQMRVVSSKNVEQLTKSGQFRRRESDEYGSVYYVLKPAVPRSPD